MTETENTTPEALLAEIVANHFVDARVIERDGVQVVVLGEGLPEIACRINTLQEEAPFGAFISLTITGGRLGAPGALVTASGYGDNPTSAIVAAGCNWACAFGPVLLTGIGRPELITTQDPEVEQFETVLGGRRYLVTVAALDRAANAGVEEIAQWRGRLGGPSALTQRVLASGTIPHSRTDDVLPLGCFAGIGPTPMSEVKFGAGDWEAGRAVLDGLGTMEGAYVLLREWALLTPLEPAPGLTRESLQNTLDLLRTQRDDPHREAGWRGGRAHGMRLGPPGHINGVDLPADFKWYVEQIAVSGAAPGYGLEPRVMDQGWMKVARAGCGANWLLNLGDGSVWLDSRTSDEQIRQVAPSFASWYEAWLDNAIRGGGPFAQWQNGADAALKVLADMVRQGRLEELSQSRVSLATGTDPVGPCHVCESCYADHGVPGTVFDPELGDDDEPTIVEQLT
ncbi:MAG: SMI1/KNR4 family protein [Arachnia propionica]|uniref:SMI1/KNR4 family protein n=1 Tax=Arachnia propionica TaxID=1750 RepID=UPI002707F549|nr:SMI1/KNR4 family protein [Arachnia propionica]